VAQAALSLGRRALNPQDAHRRLTSGNKQLPSYQAAKTATSTAAPSLCQSKSDTSTRANALGRAARASAPVLGGRLSALAPTASPFSSESATRDGRFAFGARRMEPPPPRAAGAASASAGTVGFALAVSLFTGRVDRAMPGASSSCVCASLRSLELLSSLVALAAFFLLPKRRSEEERVSSGAGAASSSGAGSTCRPLRSTALRTCLRALQQHRSTSAPSEAMLESPKKTAAASSRDGDAGARLAGAGGDGDGDGTTGGENNGVGGENNGVSGGGAEASPAGSEGAGGDAMGMTSQSSQSAFSVAFCSPPGAQHRQPTSLFNDGDHMMKPPQDAVDAAAAAQF
jgi:hypothetical protein